MELFMDYMGCQQALCPSCEYLQICPLHVRLAKLERVATASAAYLEWTHGEAREEDGLGRYDELQQALAALEE